MLDNVESPSAIYMAGRQEWNDRYGSFITERRWSRGTILVLAVGFCVSGLCNVWQSSQSRVQPFIERVNAQGEVYDVRPLPIAPPPDAARIKRQLSDFVMDIRVVYSDPSAVLTNARQAYSWADKNSEATGLLDAWFQANNPNKRAEKEEVGVAIQSVGQIGNNTWQIDWTETHTTKDGMGPTKDYWRANIKITVAIPSKPKELSENPNGVWVQWFSVTPRIS